MSVPPPGPPDTEQTQELAGLPLGEILIRQGKLSTEKLDQALKLGKKWGVPVGEVLLAQGWIRSMDFYKALALRMGKRFVDIMKQPPSDWLVQANRTREYSALLVIPWREEDGKILLACCGPSKEIEEFAKANYGEQYDLVITARFDILWTLQRLFGESMSAKSVNALADRDPELSARVVFADSQMWMALAVVTVLMVCLYFEPLRTLIAVNFAIAVFYLVIFGLRALLSWHGSARYQEHKITRRETRKLVDTDLPVYTVLVPMYKEPEVLPILAAALRKLDYPRAKLDIKLLLEEGDTETIDAAKKLNLEGIFEIVRIPPSHPQTKPKACNYGLFFARGDYVTIFDAEDKPEPDQLKKVVVAFQKAHKDTACIQCRLNYYNREENWLTRMFTLEYSNWFDMLLPGLERLGIPIPLGGTSNHFKTKILRSLMAWDPYNVTEDADLGVRMTQKRYRCEVANATTFEEANTRFGNWIRQRSRWVKGYMQTYLVHMRHPIRLYRTLGTVGFWGFQMFIGGTIFCLLVNPILWFLFAGWAVGAIAGMEAIFPPFVVSLSLFNLLIGNLAMIYFNLLAAYKRGYYKLIPYAFTTPFYWMMMSIAAYKGLWQLIHNPFYWEKTQHGISKYTAQELADASE